MNMYLHLDMCSKSWLQQKSSSDYFYSFTNCKKRIFDLKYVYLALDAQFNNACSYTTLKFVIQNSERQKGLIYPVFQNISIILQQITRCCH